MKIAPQSKLEKRKVRASKKKLSCTLESRIIGGVGIIGGLDIVIIINNRGSWTGLRK